MADRVFLLPWFALGSVGGLLVGLVVGWILRGLQERARVERDLTAMQDAFARLSQEALGRNSDELVKRSKEQLSAVVDPLKESLSQLRMAILELERRREEAYGELRTHLNHLATAHQELQRSTQQLTQLLRTPHKRGRWGEFQLRRVVELAGLTAHVDFQEQMRGKEGGRPDMLVYLPHRGVIPVDAKVPLDAYWAAMEAENESTRRQYLNEHAKALRARIRELGRRKYWEQFEQSPDFVVMFVPGEAILTAAFEADGNLMEEAVQQRVLLTTPVTLLALLKTIAYGWQQHDMSENARRIAQQGRELYSRFVAFVGHLAKVGKGLQASVRAYNQALQVLEDDVLPVTQRLRTLGVSGEEIPALNSVRTEPHLPRSLES